MSGRLSRLVPGTAAALALALGAAGTATAATPVARIGHDGRWLTDAQGRVVILHGINMVDKRPPYAPDAVGFGDDDAAFLASEGMNTVRVGVIYKAVEPQPGAYDDAYLARIEKTVRTLDAHGIVSLLDFHQDLFNERFQGEGWPDWAVQDDGLPNQPMLGFPGNYLGQPATQRAFDHFWANDPIDPTHPGVGLQDRYAAAWEHVAARFADVPGVLGYDLLNEPWPGTDWQPCAQPATGCPDFDAKLTAFSKRTIAAIRQADPRTLAFYEPNVLFNDSPPTHLGAIGDPHAAMSFHDYCLVSPAPACEQLDDTVFSNAAKRAADTGDATLLTEFGATDDASVLTDMVQRADRFMVGWQEWHYCGCDDPTTSGPGATQALVLDPAKPPTGANVKTAKAAILARPYPQAIAGTPTAFGFESGRLTLRYVTDRASGVDTEVAVPGRAFPDGYTAKASGAAIVSAADAPILLLAACPGAAEVRLVVSPGSGAADGGCVRALSARTSAKRVRIGRRATLAITVTAAGHPVAGADVSYGSTHATTGAAGTAKLRFTPRRRGVRRIAVRAPGSATALVRIRVTR